MKKEIHISPNYLVDEDGEIYNAKSGNKKAQFVNRDGYKVIDVYRENKATRYTVHRFVAIAFIPNPENKPCVNHIDGNKQNNKVSNLEWVTYKENAEHAVKLGLLNSRRGSKNNLATITEDQVHEVCKMIEEGYRNKDIYNKLEITPAIVKQIRAGKTWTHVSNQYTLNSKSHTISTDTVHWICKMMEAGYKNQQIVNMATNQRVNKSLVTRIRCKRVFTYISDNYNI